MKRKLNAVLAVICLIILIALPVRNLLTALPPDSERGEAFWMASYIMLALFGALTLVSGWRAIRGSGSRGDEKAE